LELQGLSSTNCCKSQNKIRQNSLSNASSQRRTQDAKPNATEAVYENQATEASAASTYQELGGVYEEIEEGYQRLPPRVPPSGYEHPIN
jgi:hypothetical protein